MNDCPRRFDISPPCQFEARYDKEPVIGSKTPRLVYVKDVCVRCGNTIKREE